jgi:hypothetical protein
MQNAECRNKPVSFLPGNALSFSASAGCKKAWKRRVISAFFLLTSAFQKDGPQGALPDSDVIA